MYNERERERERGVCVVVSSLSHTLTSGLSARAQSHAQPSHDYMCALLRALSARATRRDGLYSLHDLIVTHLHRMWRQEDLAGRLLQSAGPKAVPAIVVEKAATLLLREYLGPIADVQLGAEHASFEYIPDGVTYEDFREVCAKHMRFVFGGDGPVHALLPVLFTATNSGPPPHELLANRAARIVQGLLQDPILRHMSVVQSVTGVSLLTADELYALKISVGDVHALTRGSARTPAMIALYSDLAYAFALQSVAQPVPPPPTASDADHAFYRAFTTTAICPMYTGYVHRIDGGDAPHFVGAPIPRSVPVFEREIEMRGGVCFITACGYLSTRSQVNDIAPALAMTEEHVFQDLLISYLENLLPPLAVRTHDDVYCLADVVALQEHFARGSMSLCLEVLAMIIDLPTNQSEDHPPAASLVQEMAMRCHLNIGVLQRLARMEDNTGRIRAFVDEACPAGAGLEAVGARAFDMVRCSVDFCKVAGTLVSEFPFRLRQLAALHAREVVRTACGLYTNILASAAPAIPHLLEQCKIRGGGGGRLYELSAREFAAALHVYEFTVVRAVAQFYAVVQIDMCAAVQAFSAVARSVEFLSFTDTQKVCDAIVGIFADCASELFVRLTNMRGGGPTNTTLGTLLCCGTYLAADEYREHLRYFGALLRTPWCETTPLRCWEHATTLLTQRVGRDGFLYAQTADQFRASSDWPCPVSSPHPLYFSSGICMLTTEGLPDVEEVTGLAELRTLAGLTVENLYKHTLDTLHNRPPLPLSHFFSRYAAREHTALAKISHGEQSKIVHHALAYSRFWDGAGTASGKREEMACDPPADVSSAAHTGQSTYASRAHAAEDGASAPSRKAGRREKSGGSHSDVALILSGLQELKGQLEGVAHVVQSLVPRP